MTTPLPVTYTPEAGGVRAKVEVDGFDLTGGVSRLTIDHRAGDAPLVFLELKRGAVLDPVLVDAVVHIREVVEEDPADAMLRFLEPLDPAEFETACLKVLELGGAQTFGQAAIDVLKGYADGGS